MLQILIGVLIAVGSLLVLGLAGVFVASQGAHGVTRRHGDDGRKDPRP